MPDQADHRYEVFVSFADGERDWVEGYLLPALALPSGRVITDQPTSSSESFQLGAPVVSEFERAVTNSRFTLLVLSRDYLSDQWATFGEQLASYTAVAEQRDHLIPLLRERDCPLPLHIEFRVSLDCTEQSSWEAEIGRLRQLLAQPEPKPERIPCPYPGMVPFQEKDARFFYGREGEIRQMLQHFRNQRLLFVIGPSGCGKSSLVFAGVLPQLQSSAYFVEGYWLVKLMRPGPHPLQELGRVLGGDPTSESVAKLLTANPPAQRLLLVVDQFEELFSQAERAEQSGFVAALQILRAVENCALLITMRADFYPELMNSDIWGEASSHRVEIAPLRGDALRAAIEKPAGDVGVYLERGLVDRLVSDAAEEPGSLPLLQETMRLLWAEMARRFLPLGAYEQLGVGSRSGLAVAIANKADATLNELPSEQQVIARRIFLRLVQFGEGRPDTRRQQLVSSLRSERDGPQLFDKTLRHLADDRLVTVTGEEGGQEKKVDLAHEAIITGWPQLQEWLKERRGAEQTRRRLEDKAEEWIRLQRRGGLLDEIEIKEAEQWLQGPDAAELGGQSAALQDLLQASTKAIQEQKKQEEEARQRELEQARALAEEQQRFAEEQRQHAATAHRLALNALAMALAGQATEMARGRPEQNDLAALLACQAHLFSLRSGEFAASQVDQALRAVLCLPHFGGNLETDQDVTSLAFDCTGRYLASGGIDGTIEIWDLHQHNCVRSLLRGGSLTSRIRLHGDSCIHWLSFGPGARSLAAICGVEVQVWSDWEHSSSLATIGRATLLMNNRGYPSVPPFAVAASADGTFVAYGSEEGIEVWQLPSADADRAATDCKAQLSNRLSSEPCRTLGFTLDDRALILVSGSDGVVTIRNIDSPGQPIGCVRPQKWVVEESSQGASLIPEVALGPGGYAVAQCPKYRSSQGTTVVWSLRDELEPAPHPLRDGRFWNQGSVRSQGPAGNFVQENSLVMTFSPGCKSLAVGQSNEIRLWDVNRPKSKPFLMRGQGVRCLAFSPSSDLLVSAGGPQVRIWRLLPIDTTTTILAEYAGAVREVGFSPDSSALISCGTDQKIQVWDLHRIDVDPVAVDVSKWKAKLAFHELQLKSPNFEEQEPLPLRFPITFSRDGRLVALLITEQDEQGLREALAVMDVLRPDAPTILPAPMVLNDVGVPGQRRLNFFAATFSIEGNALITFDFDHYTYINASDSRGPIRRGFVRRWDLLGKEILPTTLCELEGIEPMAAFSPDARFLASATNERGQSAYTSVRVWRLDSSGKNPVTLGETESRCSALVFSNDGHIIAVGGESGDIAFWDQGRPGSSPCILRGHRDRICSLVFSPDGSTLASGGADGTIRFWNLRQMRTTPVILEGHQGEVCSIQFSRDGRILASGGEDGTVRLWIAQREVLADLVQQKFERSLSTEEWSQFVGEGFEDEHLESPLTSKPVASVSSSSGQ